MLKNTLAAAFWIAAFGSQLAAQSLYGTIAGNVTDPSEAPTAGAR